MGAEIPHLAGFRIEGDASDQHLVLHGEAEGAQTRYRVTPEMVYRLAAELPRYANQLANKRGLSDLIDSEGLRLKVDAVELSDASVVVDVELTTLVLSISDVIGTQCSWSFDALFALKLAHKLLTAAERMKAVGPRRADTITRRKFARRPEYSIPKFGRAQRRTRYLST